MREKMLAKNIMSTNVICLRPEETVKEAIAKFGEHHISGAPVINENNKLVGIVTESDILKSLKVVSRELKMVYPSIPMMGISFIELTKRKDLLKALEDVTDLPVSKIMATNVVTALQDAKIEDVVHLMVERKINRVPVVDDKGEVVGIITRGDLIRWLHQSPEER